MTPEEQAIADWQAREAARLAELAKYEPLAGLVDLDAVNTARGSCRRAGQRP